MTSHPQQTHVFVENVHFTEIWNCFSVVHWFSSLIKRPSYDVRRS